MKNITQTTFRIAGFAVLALALTACSGSRRCQTNPAYAQTERLPDLIVPAGLSQPPQDKAMAIPGEERLAYKPAGSADGEKTCVAAPPALPTVEVKRDRRSLQELRRRSEINEI